MGDSTVPEMTAPMSKKDPDREGSTESSSSTPEAADQEAYNTQENPQQQKRKGGRKPIYATSEERKQRNRQAQAAFRERRTEYIKQLESTIKHHEETLQSLQQSHRSAADECLMLRYKNSLLERILLEKGIDVQAELQAKTGSPNLGPVQRPPQAATASPLQAPIQQRAIMNRHQQARRSIVGMPQKVDGVQALSLVQPDGRSPLSQPTPASHISSPSTTATKSPNFLPQPGAIQSPNFGPIAHQQHMRPAQQQQQPPRSQFAQPPQRPSILTHHQASGSSNGSGVAVHNGANTSQNSYYPSPFQSHMDQLEQEYDAQAEILDEDPSDQSAGPGPYPSQFSTPQLPPQASNALQQSAPLTSNPPPYQSPASLQPADQQNGSSGGFQVQNHMFDPYDPMLDADPFGLSASMHFPTQFSYESR